MKPECVSSYNLDQIIKNRKPLGIFYAIENTSSIKTTFVACDNRTGDAWVEEFGYLEDCLQWLQRRENALGKILNDAILDDVNNWRIEMRMANSDKEFKGIYTTYPAEPSEQTELFKKLLKELIYDNREAVFVEALRRHGYDFPHTTKLFNRFNPIRLSASITDNVSTFYVDNQPFLSKTTVTTVTDYDDTPHKPNVHIIYSFL